MNGAAERLWPGARNLLAENLPGILVCAVVALAATFLSEHYGGPQLLGIFLGGTIHDVAQVVAASMMVGQNEGEVATVVKLFRVMLLMPIVLLVSFAYGRRLPAGGDRAKPVLVPGFLLLFSALVVLASLQVFPAALTEAAHSVSRWFLVVAIAGAGVRTRFEDLLKLGWQPVVMLVAETVFIAAAVLVVLLLFKLGG